MSIELKGFKNLKQLSESSSVNVQNLQIIPLDLLVPCKYQPRKYFDDGGLDDLVQSIKVHGVLQPILVRKISDTNKYEIIAGERRWRAARKLAIENIPAIVKSVDDNLMLAFSIVENIQRENLNPIEEAASFFKFQQDFNMSHSNIAEMVGRSRSSVSNTLRLLSLCDMVKELLVSRKIEVGHAKILVSLSANQQMKISNLIISKSLSVRETENLARNLDTEKKRLKVFTLDGDIRERAEAWKNDFSNRINSKVDFQVKRDGKGKLVIHFDSTAEMNWLMDHIKVS